MSGRQSVPLGRRLARSGRTLLRWWREKVPPTGRGWLLLAASAAVLWLYGYKSLDLLLFVIGVCGIFLVLLASIAVLGAFWYLRRRDGGSELRRLEAGSRLRTGFALPSLARVPLVQITWRWERPRARVTPRWAGPALLEEVVAEGRAEASRIERCFTVADAFGLAAIQWRRAEEGPLLVLPAAGRLRELPVVRSLSAAEGMYHPAGAAEGDRMELRRYEPGDSIRHILWKTYARTRELNVRLPERSVSPARRTVAYLVTGAGDEAAAAAARVAISTGALGRGWAFGADGTREPAVDREAAERAIARSGSPEAGEGAAPGAGLAPFLRRVLAEGEAHCIVFAPARSGPWLRAAVAAVAAYPGVLSFVLGTDGIHRPGPQPLWWRLLWQEEKAAGAPAAEVATVVGTLAATGSSAVVVDRASGRTYGRGYRQALGLAV